MTSREVGVMISGMARLVTTLRSAAGENPAEDMVVPCKARSLLAASDEIARWHNTMLTLLDEKQIEIVDQRAQKDGT
jgi:hypothetical protein